MLSQSWHLRYFVNYLIFRCGIQCFMYQWCFRILTVFRKQFYIGCLDILSAALILTGWVYDLCCCSCCFVSSIFVCFMYLSRTSLFIEHFVFFSQTSLFLECLILLNSCLPFYEINFFAIRMGTVNIASSFLLSILIIDRDCCLGNNASCVVDYRCGICNKWTLVT